jgi:formylglycine-generating enzyme required for sulfatase activity/serine/threonine protein kinase
MLSPGVVLQQRYRIKRLLARGGMGAVYEAEAVHLRNVIVAVKETLYNEDRKNMREQFEREAATLARLRHPALPQVKDHFIEGNGQFLVMDFIAGDDLGELLGQRMSENGEPFEFRQVLEWADRLLDALVYIHGQYPPVIHRDIKPQNLKLTPRGELFLIDFGLAKDATTPTRPGNSVRAYTLEFAPPEQIKGEKTDARSDIYSLGATLYAMVTGKLPPDARVREESLRHLMPDLLQPAHRVNPQTPFAFAVTLAKSMALDRKQRYQSAQEMRDALLPIKRAIEAEIAEKERRDEEARERKTARRRQRKESAEPPSKKAVEAEIADREEVGKESGERKTTRRRQRKEPAQSPSKKAGAAGIVEKELREEEERKSPEGAKTGRQRQSKGAKRPPSKKAVEAEIAEREWPEEEGLKTPEKKSSQSKTGRRRQSEEAPHLVTLLDEVNRQKEDSAKLKRAQPDNDAPAGVARQTVALERPIDQEKTSPEPAPAEPQEKRKTLRVALGAIASNLLVVLVAYLLWNLALLAYLFWNFASQANSTREKIASANLPIVVSAEPVPSPTPAPSYFVLPARIEMIYVPGGAFLMGSPENETDRLPFEGPQRQVTVPSFYIGRYEVTQAQWRAVMGENPSHFKGDDLPVENVSWDDAKNFCRELSLKGGQEYRLPTEAEWEYACRAGTTGANAGDLDEMVWYNKNSDHKTQRVGMKQPNKFGLYDLRGNVWEWCEDDWHNSYANAPRDASAWVDDPGRGPRRVFRGLSWRDIASNCRSAYRSGEAPSFRGSSLGMRIVRTYR